ncbi:MAG: DUF4192 domain-containing protein [Mycobacteriales bacterium]
MPKHTRKPTRWTSPDRPVARLTTPAEMVASLPVCLGYTPSESLVVGCCHEPRGRMGLTVRIDLPGAEHETAVVDEVERIVRGQRSTRVLLAVYTEEADGRLRARTGLVDALRDRFADLVVTEAVLVRGGRFWSYLCSVPTCCPPEGTPVDAARDAAPLRLLEAEQVLSGKVQLADREELERTLASPSLFAAELGRQRCETALDLRRREGRARSAETSLQAWAAAVDRWRDPPASLGDMEAAQLAMSLMDVHVRDRLAASPSRDVPPLLALLEELCRRIPSPYDAPVCTLFGWLTYCEGGGAAVTIALERALRSDPDYGLAHLLSAALLAALPPRTLRRIAQAGRGLGRAC